MGTKGWHNSIGIRIGLFVGSVILVFVGVAIYRETVKKNQIQAEIDQLREEADKISKKNSLIREKIAYFQSRDYLEMEAKDKLNLKSPDEQVVIVKPNVATKEVPAEPEKRLEKPATQVAVANHIKWWNYFFKY